MPPKKKTPKAIAPQNISKSEKKAIKDNYATFQANPQAKAEHWMTLDPFKRKKADEFWEDLVKNGGTSAPANAVSSNISGSAQAQVGATLPPSQPSAGPSPGSSDATAAPDTSGGSDLLPALSSLSLGSAPQGTPAADVKTEVVETEMEASETVTKDDLTAPTVEQDLTKDMRDQFEARSKSQHQFQYPLRQPYGTTSDEHGPTCTSTFCPLNTRYSLATDKRQTLHGISLPFKNKFFVKTARIPLVHGKTKNKSNSLEMCRGYYYNVKPGMGNIILNFNLSTSAIFRPVLVSEFMVDNETFENYERRKNILNGKQVYIEYDRKDKYPQKQAILNNEDSRFWKVCELQDGVIEDLEFRKKLLDAAGQPQIDPADGSSWLMEPNTTKVVDHLFQDKCGFGTTQYSRASDVDIPPLLNPLNHQALKAKLQLAVGKNLALLILLLSSADVAAYRNLKDLCDRFFGVQFNLKFGGINHTVTAVQEILQDTIVLGADLVHPSTGAFEGTPSIAAVVGSVDEYGGQYLGSLRLQDVHKTDREIVDRRSLTDMVLERLQAYYLANGTLPAKIIYFQDGVSSGHYSKVRDIELEAIRDACQSALTQDPNRTTIDFAAVIVTKRHHTRFYPQQLADGDPWGNKNTPPGTCVDQLVTSPYYQDFYLQSHSGIKGTAKPAHYFVLENNIPKLTLDSLRTLTHNLCYSYVRSMSGVSYASPTYYADRLCERGHLYIRRFYLGNDDDLKKDLHDEKVKLEDAQLKKRQTRFSAKEHKGDGCGTKDGG
ncbi:Piwi domain-containing protein [Paraphoma chrysanthemicola]|nr:Piwi domain-containing protein [Paraphoma chrysanthemicola]